MTPGGIPVRNVAMPLIRRPYAIYTLGGAKGAGGSMLTQRQETLAT